jgi:DNA-binding transcriptional MerR regulator
MSLAQIEITKLYYSIGEVAEMFDVNPSLIRFWEKEFNVIKPKKNKKGNRLFTAKDIEVLKRIYSLVKIEGYTLEGAKIKLKSKSRVQEVELVSSDSEVIDKLMFIKEELIRLKSTF